MLEFSVLMSVYIKEKPEYLEQCLSSLATQSVLASEWVIVEDGPISNELEIVLKKFENEYPGLIKRIKLEKNVGLGAALRVGIMECKYELIARMDTDDVCKNDRFEKQIKLFEANPLLDVCGTYIDEFEDNVNNIVACRKVPLKQEEIEEYQKRRDAFNHVSVMFKKSAVLAAGNYEACPLMEDTYLWVRMLANGIKCINIPESLVLVRVGKDMIERRGGWSYYKKYKKGRKMVLSTGYIGYFDYAYTVIIQFFVALFPPILRRFIYTKLLRKDVKGAL